MRPSTTPASIRVHGRVADRADRLARLEERAHERDRLGLGAQVVGVRDPARQHQAVVVAGVGVGRGDVDLEGVALVEVVERLDLAGLGRDQVGLGARRLDRLARLGQLDLLDALVGDEERDPLALQFVSHPGSFRCVEDFCADCALPWTHARTRALLPVWAYLKLGA